MTAWGWVVCVGAVLILSSLFGFGLLTLLGPRIYANGVRAGQVQTHREFGLFAGAAEGYNPAGIPRPRDRAADHQMTARNMPAPVRRPGFYAQR